MPNKPFKKVKSKLQEIEIKETNGFLKFFIFFQKLQKGQNHKCRSLNVSEFFIKIIQSVI